MIRGLPFFLFILILCRGSHRPKIVQPKKPCESDKNIFYSECVYVFYRFSSLQQFLSRVLDFSLHSTFRYIPCNHVDCCVLEHELPTFSESAGNGDSSSSLRECCVESGHRCEKFCICPASCLNRWPGCNCRHASLTSFKHHVLENQSSLFW